MIARMKTLAERLRYAKQQNETRANKKIGYGDIAAAAGISTSTVSNIANGTRGVKRSSGSIPAIAKALDVRYEWLESGEGEMRESDASNSQPAEVSTQVQLQADQIAHVMQLIPESKRLDAFLAAMRLLWEFAPSPGGEAKPHQ